jgi:hypothetical protein
VTTDYATEARAAFDAHVAACHHVCDQVEALTATLRALGPSFRLLKRQRRRLLRQRRRACRRHLGYVPPKPPLWLEAPLSPDVKVAVVRRAIAEEAARQGAVA